VAAVMAEAPEEFMIAGYAGSDLIEL